jgi:CubicO group peptidase (beta-lactamase class C family)
LTPTPIAKADPAACGIDRQRLGHLRTSLEREVAAGRIPGAVVGVMRRGRLAAMEAVGLRDPAAKAAMSSDALFSIASMTKPMTSVAILQLLEEGRLLLGDPVCKYLPELAGLMVAGTGTDGALVTRPAARQPTIQDLLRHTSGMTYQDRGTSAAHSLYPGSSMAASVRLSRTEYLTAMAKAPLLFDPGEGWEYGFSTDILGLVVEAVTGQTLGTALAERIWTPLGMVDTSFAVPAEKMVRYAHAFATDPETGAANKVHHASGRQSQWESGGGGAVSTAADYLRFIEMLRRGGSLDGVRILGRKTVSLMTADHLPAKLDNRVADAMDPAAAGYGFGLGVAVRRSEGMAAMTGSAGDYYWSGVYGTYFWVDPAEDLAVVSMLMVPGLARMRYRQMVRVLVYQAIAD